MAKKKQVKKARKRHDRITLTEEDRTQLQMLLDRVMAQDPEGERFSQFVESLKPLIQRSVPFTLAFVEALGSTPSPVAVNVLQILQKIPTEKPVRRALKQALYRLERQGLVIKEEDTESEPRVLIPRPADRQAEAWASWPESQGERGMVLKLPDAGRGYVMAIAVVNSEGVFHEFEAIQTTRKGVRALLDKMTGGVEGRLIEIPLEHFRLLLEEVAETYQRQNHALPSGYEPIHKHLASQVEVVSRPHVYNLLDEKEIAEDPILLRTSESLLEVQPFVTWRLPEGLIQSFVKKIKELSESRLVISQSAQMERTAQIYREAAAEIFTPELRQHYRRLL
ncbi:MAG: hypothetical protein GWN86_28000, partial [Desulfobacterales bacterium]|nr:hypothetical protein [Desulfobacterales bacterium]